MFDLQLCCIWAIVLFLFVTVGTVKVTARK